MGMALRCVVELVAGKRRNQADRDQADKDLELPSEARIEEAQAGAAHQSGR